MVGGETGIKEGAAADGIPLLYLYEDGIQVERGM